MEPAIVIAFIVLPLFLIGYRCVYFSDIDSNDTEDEVHPINQQSPIHDKSQKL